MFSWILTDTTKLHTYLEDTILPDCTIILFGNNYVVLVN